MKQATLKFLRDASTNQLVDLLLLVTEREPFLVERLIQENTVPSELCYIGLDSILIKQEISPGLRQDFEVTPEMLEALQHAYVTGPKPYNGIGGSKISAIKVLRNLTQVLRPPYGIGLKESKDVVEWLMDRRYLRVYDDIERAREMEERERNRRFDANVD